MYIMIVFTAKVGGQGYVPKQCFAYWLGLTLDLKWSYKMSKKHCLISVDFQNTIYDRARCIWNHLLAYLIVLA